MACIVYREGEGTFEHGIECESANCEIEHLEGMLASGWSLNPPGYVAPEPVPPEPEEDSADPGSSSPDLHERLDALAEENRLLIELNDHLEAEVVRLNEALEAATTPPTDDVDEDEDVDETPEGVREAAKAAGIEGWDTKRIATLKKALEA